MQRLLRAVSAVVLCLAVAGCGLCVASHPGPTASAFFRLDITDQVKQFKTYAIEEQYELFEFGNQVVHPPAIYLAEPFAQRGPSVVPFLVKKLKDSGSGAEVRDIALVFSELNDGKLYDFLADPGPINLLEQKASSLGGVWGPTTLKMVSEIKGSGSASKSR